MRERFALAGVVAAIVVTTATPAVAADAEMTVWDTTGGKPARCTDIDADDPLDIRGGCPVRVTATDIRFSVRSVVGDLTFVTCGASYTLRVDGSGRTATNALFGGPSPCNDVRRCQVRDGEFAPPWSGRLVAGTDGSLRNIVDVCFDTCMGQFKGRMAMRLTPSKQAWRAEPVDPLLSTSGFVMEGAWRMAPPGFEVRAS